MTEPQIPVFDASSEFHQNLGLLKVAETAMRKLGDVVMIRASESRQMLLLTGTESIRYWKNHQGQFQTELGDIASNAGTTRILIGDALERPENAAIWDASRSGLAEVNARWDDWAHRSLTTATRALVRDLALTAEAPVDLRPICSLWAVRALCPTLFGDALPDQDMVDGLMQIEQFYFAMSTKDADEIAHPERLAEFQQARGFLDRAVRAGLAQLNDETSTVLATMNKCLPETLSEEQRIDFLRPTLGRLLLEKLNIDGLGLLWTLCHLAQSPDLVPEMAREVGGCADLYDAPDTETPLCYSVIQEAQRLYPELPFIYRITSKEMEVQGYNVPPRTTILFAPWLVHRDGRYWDTPNRFDGHRFLTPPEDRNSYLPFGIGPRVRSRSRFLQHQLSVAVRAVVAEFDLQLAPDCKRGNLRPILRSTLAPRGAVPVAFRYRTAATEAATLAL
ncbi:cytochrome P450 [Epibacterium sp. MM17-32]|uniref:cytochrome P450 n=1 Tax=Epibacterium sp. MM17-32 TaxID=2917734 RepID=UPI001EF526FD|nr:cytochrome P450 [Epibacterium sp. MM17-32]MCG7626770.1 cytochrome P450 [Epibacterium sp. MM17-32]